MGLLYKKEGSAGNHSFEFRKGEYLYECSIIVTGEEDSPPAYLTIYESGKKMLSEEADKVKK